MRWLDVFPVFSRRFDCSSGGCLNAGLLLLSQQEGIWGVTGDTAGFFVLFCEGCIVVVAAFIDVFVLK